MLFFAGEGERQMNDKLVLNQNIQRAILNFAESTKKRTIKKELYFLESLNIGDLYKQATQDRSHFYVGSKCKLILERIEFLKKQLEEKRK